MIGCNTGGGGGSGVGSRMGGGGGGVGERSVLRIMISWWEVRPSRGGGGGGGLGEGLGLGRRLRITNSSVSLRTRFGGGILRSRALGGPLLCSRMTTRSRDESRPRP